jgi:YD repeat-containing protein
MRFRKLTFALSVIAISSVLFFSCNQSPSGKTGHSGVEYYRSIVFSETPWDTERGGRKLSPEQAREINSYRFTYDNKGRLLSVEYVRGDELLGYSSMGGAAKITYEYTDNKQIKRFYNEKNEQIESAGAYTSEYTLDDKGERTGLKFFGKNGEPVENRNKIHSWVWTVLDDGMVRELRYNLENKETVMNEFCPFYELRFTYNNNGYVTRMANYKADTLYNCTVENCGDIGVSYFSFVPNENGEVESFSVYNVFGQMSNLYWGWSRRENKYDENGYVTETAYLDQDNEFLGGKNVPVTKYVYDKYGAVTETINMDKDRNIINNPANGVAITEYKYDDKGNRTETIRLNKDRVQVTQ